MSADPAFKNPFLDGLATDFRLEKSLIAEEEMDYT